MIIRSEQLKDYSKIAQLNYLAFSNWHPEKISVHESEMVALARASSMYDSELSIVAEKDGEIIGHVLLVPSHFIVLGEIVKGVLLGPIAVLPRYQKTGIGSKLIERGHAIAREKGYAFSLLCGHPSYYPRFGYLQKVFSVTGTEIKLQTAACDDTLSERPLRLDDLPLIRQWQKEVRQNDSLAIYFDDNLMEYHSNALHMKRIVITKGDKPIGFARYSTNNPAHIQTLFFENDYLAYNVCYLMQKLEKSTLTIQQPCEVFENMLSGDEFLITDKRKAREFFMVCPFTQGGLITTYCEKVLCEALPLGVISYPPFYDVDV